MYILNNVYSTSADFVFIPENPPLSDNWEDDMCKVLDSVNI